MSPLRLGVSVNLLHILLKDWTTTNVQHCRMFWFCSQRLKQVEGSVVAASPTIQMQYSKLELGEPQPCERAQIDKFHSLVAVEAHVSGRMSLDRSSQS